VNSFPEDAERLYQQAILRHSRTPLHASRPARVDASAVGDNPMCGDRVEVFVRRDATGAIADIGFEAQGCAISIASADLMADLLRGAQPADARRIDAAFQHMIQTGDTDDAALETLRPLRGVHDYPSRRRCATLPWHALMQALSADLQGAQ
jgi:nitrogen fixation NifU-like protein